MNNPLLKPPRDILIVDDAFDVRAMLKEILRSTNITNIDEANNSKVALEKLRKFSYQLVYLDIELPDSSGLLVLQTIKQLYRNTRVIIISAHNTANNVRSAIIQGADGFIVKPFSTEKILSFANKFFSRTN